LFCIMRKKSSLNPEGIVLSVARSKLYDTFCNV